MATNKGNGIPRDKEVKVRLSVEEREAVRSIRELERQFTKLSQLANRGQNVQDGFLSRRQVQLYKNILNEMQQAHEQYTKRLDASNAEVARRQQQYNSAQARGASQTHVNFYGNKLQQAQSKQQFLQNVVTQQQSTLNRTNGPSGPVSTIGGMHQLSNGGRDIVHAIRHYGGSAGLILGAHQGAHYMLDGARLASAQEHNAWQQSQKMGNYGGDFRQKVWDAQAIGDSTYGQKFGLGYDTNQTLSTQSHLMYGGTDGNKQKLADDTLASQQFSRAYGMSSTANIVAADNTMRQIGAVQEGDQRRFANLLAGAIEKGSMRGREEEMLRATTQLVGQIGNKMATVTPQTLQNTVAMQTMLGNAIPGLKGDRGAQVLGNMDNAIKNGGEGMDILLGKGIDPKYMSLKGMNQLSYQKEEGLTPQNLSTVLGNARKLTNGNQDVLESILTDPSNGLGLTHHQFRSLKDTGILDRWTRGETISASDLQKTGALSVDKGVQDYRNSWQFKGEQADAMLDKTKSDAGLPALRAQQEGKSLWSSLPEPLQMLGIGVGSIFGGNLLSSGVKRLARGPWNQISNGGFGNWLKSSRINPMNWFQGGTPPTGGGSGGASLLSRAWGGVRSIGPGLLRGLGVGIATNIASNAGDSWGASAGDWVFGHKKGMQKDYLDSSKGAWQDDRKPLWDRIFSSDSTPTASGSNAALNVATLNIQDKNFADLINKTTTSTDGRQDVSNFSAVASNHDTKSTKGEYTVNVKVSGKVDGMTDQNQQSVSDSIGSFFKNILHTDNGGFNLAMDFKRQIG